MSPLISNFLKTFVYKTGRLPKSLLQKWSVKLDLAGQSWHFLLLLFFDSKGKNTILETCALKKEEQE